MPRKGKRGKGQTPLPGGSQPPPAPRAAPRDEAASQHAAAQKPVPAKQSVKAIDPGLLGLELEKKLQITSPLPRKPGFGRLGRPIRLISNCFPLNIPSGNVYHYDVEIYNNRHSSTTTVETAIDPKDKKYRCLNTKRNREVFDAIDSEELKGVFPAYDGRKNMYTRRALKFEGKELKLSVVLKDKNTIDPSDQREPKKDSFWVYIKPVKKKETNDCVVSLDPLHALYAGRVSTVPLEAIMAIETVLRHSPCMRHIPVGQSFFYPPQYAHPLGGCKEIWFGYHQSLRLGQRMPMVNLDITATTFYQKGPLIHLFAEHMNKTVTELYRITDIDGKQMITIGKYLKNLQVEVKHLKGYKRKYRILSLTQCSASNLKFSMEDRGSKVTKSVANYFAEQHKWKLEYPNLPCVQVNPENKKRYFPLEVCDIIEGQRYNGLLTPDQTGKMVKDTARPPKERFQEITDIFNKKARFSQDPYLKEFGLTVTSAPLRLEGRQLDAPNVRYSLNVVVKPEDGSWDMRNKKFFEGASVNSWALLSFNSNRRAADQLAEFADALFTFARRQNLQLGKHKTVSIETLPANVEHFDQAVESILRDMKQRYQIDLVIVVIPDAKFFRSRGGEEDKTKVLYRTIKRVSMVMGITSQCVKEANANCKPSVVSNILLKINAKMGGINNTLTRGEIPDFMQKPVMIIGADVTHPSPTGDIACSIAAAVGSLNPHFSHYDVSIRAQINEEDRKISREVIVDLKSMIKELLLSFRNKNNGVKPLRIIFYRDGVSDGEFQNVLAEEVESIYKACESIEKDYKPGITYIVMQKRHHVRMMPENSRDGVGRMKNPPPGTVADTTITHPLNYDFYLYSHFGLQGTSRPAYYTVIYDDNKISPDDLHKLSYYLCHIFARCTKSISTPAPVRYADQAALMARQILLLRQGSKFHDPNAPKPTRGELDAISKSLKGLMFKHIV